MIAIDVIMTRESDVSPVEETLFQKVQGPIGRPEIGPHSQEIYNFFKNCIDQQFILNTVCIEASEDQTKSISRYFSTTSENAQAFLDLFLDMSAEFSIKKIWGQYGMKLSTTQSEIDFDFVEDNFDLIGENGEIWSVKY